MNWQPIETAPRDETEILVIDADGLYHIAFWCEDCHLGGSSVGPGWQVHFCDDDEYYSEGLTDAEATHWMPLPPAPKEGE